MPNSDSEGRATALAKRLPDDLRNTEAVRAFVSEPLQTAVALMTAALASGHQQMILAGGHVAQAMLKGRALKQLGKELDELQKKGKIRDDYAEAKYGFHSLVDLMTMIEGDAPDEDKLNAAKAMFIAVNSPQAPEGEAVMRFQFFRLVLRLSGPQLLLLSICNKLRIKGAFTMSTSPIAQNWLNMVAQQIGHQVFTLIEQDEAVLIQHGILTDRTLGDRSGIKVDNARLSDLGIKICDLIETYSGEIPKAASSQTSPRS